MREALPAEPRGGGSDAVARDDTAYVAAGRPLVRPPVPSGRAADWSARVAAVARSDRASGALFAAGTALLALGAATVVLEFWRMELGVPLVYRGDAVFYAGLIKGLIEQGWVLENPALGAPFVQRLADYPQQTEALHLVFMKLIGAIVHDPIAVMNLFYVASFPLTALAAAWFFRAVGVSRPVACAAAILFALLPYHFHRNVQHIFFTAYYTIPLGAYLAVATWQGRTFFGLGPRTERSRRAVLLGAFVFPILLCIAVGSATIYFAFFAALLVLFAAGATLLRGLPRSVALSGTLLAVLIAATAALHLVPSAIYWAREGPNYDGAGRSPASTQRGGMQLADLVLPMRDHRVPALAQLAERREAIVGGGEAAVALGAAGTIGLGVLGMALCRPRTRESLRARRPVGALAGLIAGAFLIGGYGAVSSLVALLVTAQFRAWSRIELFVAIFALAGTAFLIEELRRFRHARFPSRGARVLEVGALTTLLVTAVLDQTSPALVPRYDQTREKWNNEAAFVQAIESRLPAGSAILELPLIPYPSWPSPRAEGDYVEMRPYLHSRHVRWSYGQVRGREAGWQLYLTPRAERPSLRLVVAAGYTGIVVARPLFADRAAVLERYLRAETGLEPLVSAGDEWSFWDIRDFAARMAASDAAIRSPTVGEHLRSPIRLRWDAGFDPLRGDERTLVGPGYYEALHRLHDGAIRATLVVLNPSRGTRTIWVGTNVRPLVRRPARLVVRWPGNVSETLEVPVDGTALSRRLDVGPGETKIDFEAHVSLGVSTPFGRRALRFTDGWATDDDLLRLAVGTPNSIDLRPRSATARSLAAR